MAGLGAWRLKRGGAANWRTEADYAEVAPGRRVGHNDLWTRQVFGDFRLHVEFMVPSSPAGTPEQSRGNSGVYLQGRYEVQILDSYRRTLSGLNDAGAVYGVRDAARNMSRPAGQWQSYDITFRAPKYSGTRKVSPDCAPLSIDFTAPEAVVASSLASPATARMACSVQMALR